MGILLINRSVPGDWDFGGDCGLLVEGSELVLAVWTMSGRVWPRIYPFPCALPLHTLLFETALALHDMEI